MGLHIPSYSLLVPEEWLETGIWHIYILRSGAYMNIPSYSLLVREEWLEAGIWRVYMPGSAVYM